MATTLESLMNITARNHKHLADTLHQAWNCTCASCLDAKFKIMETTMALVQVESDAMRHDATGVRV